MITRSKSFIGKQKLPNGNHGLNIHFLSFFFLPISALFIILFSHSTYAIARQSTLTMNLSNDTVSVDILPSPNGTFNSSSDTTITVQTDNFTGYSLSIRADESTNLVNSNNDSIESISSSITEDTFSSNSAYNNKWGFKPSQYVSTSNNVNSIVTNTDYYLPSPTTSGNLLDITSTANTQARSYTISIGARADYTLPAGSYANTFIISAVSNEIIYNLHYDENTEDEVADMPEDNPQSAEISGGAATADSYLTLSDAVPTRTGFTFAGWCDEATEEDQATGNQTCPGNTFAPGSDFGIDQTLDNTDLEIYAIWEVNEYNLTYNYQEDYTYSADQYLDTGYQIDWSKDFTIESTFSIPTLGKRYLIVGNYNDTTATLNLEVNTSNQLRVYMGNAGVNQTSSTTIPANTDISIVYTWNATSKEYSLVATASGMSTINISGTYSSMTTAAATKSLYTNRDYRGTGTFTALSMKELKITHKQTYNTPLTDLPTVSKIGYTYDGWFTDATGGSQITTSSTMPAADTTYYTRSTAKTYTITLNKNGATNTPTVSTTATYDSTSLAAIATLPTKSNTTGTRTISGFTLTTSGTNATVTYPASGCTSASNCKSTNTTTYTFAGWYKESGATNKIASNAATPALQASTSYTDANSKWTNDGAVTLYAGWTSSAGSYSAVTLPTITRTGSTCGWSTSSTGTTITYASGGSLTPTGNTTLYGVCVTNITLNKNGATNSPTTSTTATYNATTLGAIATLPVRQYTISGFTLPSGNNADSATVTYPASGCTSASNCKSTRTFTGWYKESGATNKIASNAATPALQASTTYTDSSSKWTYTTAGAITLYAGWSGGAVTLPTITKAGYTCGWTTTSTGATSISYASGGSITPSAATTLYGVCTAIDYTITIHAGNGVSSLALSGWTGTGTATLTKTYHIGDTINLSSATPTYKTAYSGTKYIKNDSVGSISDSTYTVGAGNGDISISATTLSTPVCTIQGGTTKVYNRTATTLTATDNSSSYDTDSTNITYSFGYASSDSATLGNFGTAGTSNTTSIAKAAYRGTRYYGVKVVVTNKNDSAITATCTSGTGTNTGTNVANRTTMALVNSRIQFNANGGTISGTNPLYVQYGGSETQYFTGRTNSTAGTLPTVTAPTGSYFTGWYTAAAGGSKVINADGTLTGAVSGWTNASKQWIKTGTSNSATATANILYARYTPGIPDSDCPANKICYAPNASDVEGSMDSISSTKITSSPAAGVQDAGSNGTYTLIAPNYSRSGYGFAGWSTDTTATSSSTIYGPNETITTGDLSSHGLILYPVWIASTGNIQSWNSCSSLTIAPKETRATLASMTALTDQRDGNVYTVARLADGNCWMTENLRLDAENTTSDTNKALAQGYGDDTVNNRGKFIGLADSEDTGFSGTNTNPNSLYYSGTQSGAATMNIGTDNFPANRIPRYNNNNTNRTLTASYNGSGSGTHYQWYGYGNYYNWPAAIANTSYYNTTTADENGYTPSEAANTSLCPTGWKLPYGRSTGKGATAGGFSYLDIQMGGTGVNQSSDAGTIQSKKWRSFPNNFVYSGGQEFVSIVDKNYRGRYWSSTAYEINHSHSLSFLSDNMDPSGEWVKNNGNSIRCIVNQSNTGSTRITFNKNASDATGSMSVQTINAASSASLTVNSFTRSGYVFNSWNTKADGTGTSYANEAAYATLAGTETNDVTLYAQWDKLYTITFNIGSNATSISFDGTTYTNGQTVQAIDGRSYVIGGNFPTKSGFNSWSVTAGTLENSNAPATNYTVSGSATITLTGKQATKSITNVTASGNTPSSNCKNEAVTPELVYDPRDNEAYWVAELCDGKVWMLDNLRLDLTNSTVINKLSSSNTNATTAQLNYLKNGGGTTSDQYPTAGLSGSEWTSSYSYSVPQVVARFKDNVAPAIFGLGSGKIGVYYNYCATSAGTYCWGNGTSYTGSPSSDPNTSSYRDIGGDICPAGWHLPTGTSSGQELNALYSAYSGGGTIGGQTTLTQAVAHNTSLSTPLSGYMSSGSSQSNLGTYGGFWSSTWHNSYYMYSRSVYATSVGSGGYNRYNGRSIRCVLNDS